MSQTRDASVFLHIGAKKTGKTTDTLNMCRDLWEHQQKPCLVYNIGNQSHYDDFQEIDLSDIPKFNALAARSKLPWFQIKTIESDALFRSIVTYVRNAVIVLEDSTSYAVGNLSKPFREMILANRNSGNDLIINLHSLKDPAPFLFRSSEYIILRQTSDDPNKLPDKVLAPEKVILAMLDIRETNEFNGNRYAAKLISLQDL
ncbi:hypothetical protein [Fibrella forsythiae]|uniref:Uncharacterized protein n=1 Tax=Fibrella forsythiae TaxID=2817061 RepID=A0ABS3JME1_9BACT|nr:hypothetical protein [Fibrella forsythiae]MBO0951187.1 hypothetical protein [Fibrella forsythiae]